MFRFQDPVEAQNDVGSDVSQKGKRQVKLLDFSPSKLISFNGEDVRQFLTPVRRPARQFRRPPPVYPPFDPFNTTYQPLPGPSSPHYALRLETGNPHFSEKARFISFS